MTRPVQDRRLVRYDPMLPATGLFGSVGNGDRPKLDVRCTFGGVTWLLRGPDRLGIPEQTLLLVLLELGEEQYGQAQPPFDDWTSIDAALYCEPNARPLAALHEGTAPALATLHVSFAELSHRCGRVAEGGSAAEQIRRELMRLSEVTVWAILGSQTFSSRLIHWRRGDKRGVQVVLNARLTEILLGRQYSPVSLQERLTLQTDIARALHCALSVRIRPRETMSFNLDTLAPYVWCATDVADTTVRRRRQQLRGALCDINALSSWSIQAKSGKRLEQANSVHIFRKAHTHRGQRFTPQRHKPILEQPPGSIAMPKVRSSQPVVDVSSLFT